MLALQTSPEGSPLLYDLTGSVLEHTILGMAALAAGNFSNKFERRGLRPNLEAMSSAVLFPLEARIRALVRGRLRTEVVHLESITSRDLTGLCLAVGELAQDITIDRIFRSGYDAGVDPGLVVDVSGMLMRDLSPGTPDAELSVPDLIYLPNADMPTTE